MIEKTLPFEKIKTLKDDKVKFKHYEKRIAALRELIIKSKNQKQRVQYAREIMTCQDEMKKLIQRELIKARRMKQLGLDDEIKK